MSSLSKKSPVKFKSVGDHKQFLQRITKTLYYGKLPSTERLSLPVTELAAELFSEAQNGRSLERLHSNDAAKISRNACISPCSLVLAILYLEQLKSCNPNYLRRIAPSDLFLVSLMISSKFLHDDGEEEEVYISEWAKSGGTSTKELVRLEKEFLNEIQWQIFVNERSFWRKLKEIECAVARREGTERGWFTYTDLDNLLSMNIDVANLIRFVSNIITILTATYTLGFLTLLGSVFITSNLPGNYLYQTNGLPSTVSIENNAIENCNISKTYCNNYVSDSEECTGFKYKSKQLDAADVLKTGILLASIKANTYTRKEQNETKIIEKSDPAPWAWWANPAMNWLSESSALLCELVQIPQFKYLIYRDIPIANFKILNLEDQIHKATRVRIQDQLEQSWHVEWTDSLKNLFFINKLFSVS